MPSHARGCICGKHMLQAINEGTCVWCGYGSPRAVPELAYGRNMEAAPALTLAPAAARVRAVPPRRGRPVEWTEERCVEAARDWERMHGNLPRSVDWQEAREPGEHRPTYATVKRIFGGWPGFMRAIADVPRQALAA
jgi:hypothetical protein